MWRSLDSSHAINDATLLIAHGTQDLDTVVFHRFYNRDDPGQRGFRSLAPLTIDTTAYGTGTGYAFAAAEMTTADSVLGVRTTWFFPQHPDSADFVIVRYTVTNRSGSPVVITAGQQDRRLAFEEPILWGQMVEVARPWTKWAAEVQRIEDLPSAVRRAVETAMTPPTGPVFLSLPLDVQMARAEGLDLTPPRLPDLHVRPPADALRRANQNTEPRNTPTSSTAPFVVRAGRTADLRTENTCFSVPACHTFAEPKVLEVPSL